MAVTGIQAMDNCGAEERRGNGSSPGGRTLRSVGKRGVQDGIWENWSEDGVI